MAFARPARRREYAAEDCMLCGEPPAVMGIWTPTPECARELMATPGRTLVMIYFLCGDCLKRPDATTLVEDEFLRQAAEAAINPKAN